MNRRGLIAPILTPFNDDGSLAMDLYVQHAKRLFDQGCAGIAPFGTTGEALSVSIDERIAAITALVDAGLDPARMIPGTGLTNMPETAQLSRACLDLGCAGVMTLPPFYFKAVTEEGLYAYFAQLVAALPGEVERQRSDQEAMGVVRDVPPVEHHPVQDRREDSQRDRDAQRGGARRKATRRRVEASRRRLHVARGSHVDRQACFTSARSSVSIGKNRQDNGRSSDRSFRRASRVVRRRSARAHDRSGLPRGAPMPNSRETEGQNHHSRRFDVKTYAHYRKIRFHARKVSSYE
jgi:hypothetical protein